MKTRVQQPFFKAIVTALAAVCLTAVAARPADFQLAWDGVGAIEAPPVYRVQTRAWCAAEFATVAETTGTTFTLTNVTGLLLVRVIAVVNGAATGPSNTIVVEP